VKRLAETLGIAIEVQLPDGGKPVCQTTDQGVPLAEGIPKNALRKEIAKLARSVHEVNVADTAKAKAKA
ncbi:MAG: pilus assembly protein CpaE, partial [Rubellimicrobium sp.]|nr:pilus assembly protein CpaE [Rubellimicrobium sp.]